eukprot:c18101_g1_i1.p1 GENE.c18101_g1_i1~~c18101_g1_i1.p1  ORF type:complete len:288 (-),score=80.21 c18101_g1_i1:811-1644(-)
MTDDLTQNQKRASMVYQPHNKSDTEDVTFTIEEAIDEIGFGPTQIIVMIIVGLCCIADSMEMLLLSFIGPQIRCVWELNEFQEAILTTVVFIGMMIGAYAWGVVSDIFGRRKALLGSASFSFIFGLSCSVAPNYLLLLIFRCAAGIGIGGIPVGFAILIEFTPKKFRGEMGMAFGAALSFGGMIEAALAWTLHQYGKDWRWLIALSTMPMGLVLCLFIFLPESPHYYMARGKAFKCLHLLQLMASRRGKILTGTLTYEDRKASAFYHKKIRHIFCIY